MRRGASTAKLTRPVVELPPKTVQQRMGHASIAITMDVYGHLFPSGDDGAELAAAEMALLA